MSAHQITTLIIRLLALVWLVYLLDHTASLLIYFNEGGLQHTAGLAMNTAFTFLQYCGCAVMWFYPATTAAKILPSALANQPRPAPTPLEWQTIGLFCVGLWTLARAIPDTAYWVTLLPLIRHEGAISDTPLSPVRVASIVADAVRLALGLWLVFGARGFAAFLLRVRTAGLRIAPEQNP